jgi:ribosome-binding factor A
MKGIRPERLAEALRAELATLLREHVKDPRVAASGAQVSQVRVSGDCSHAKVLVSFVTADDKAIAGALLALDKMGGFLRGEAGRRLNLRRAPTMAFAHDKTAQSLGELDELLRQDPPSNQDPPAPAPAKKDS